MSSVAALVAVLPLLVILEAVGVGYIGIPQPSTSSQAVGGVSPQPAWGIALDSDGVGINGGARYSQQGGRIEETQYDLDLEQRLTEAASTQHLGTVGSESAVADHAMRNFASHGPAEDVRYKVAAFQYKERNNHQHRNRHQQHQQHRVPLQNMDNVQYFGEMMVGEPPQRMKMLFDTGSSDTWVPGIGCTSCGLHSAFDALASSTAVPMERNFSNRYDSGSVEGSVIKERVLVGGMAVDGVEMGLVRRQEQHIRGFKADGIVGLAFPSISTTQNTSPSQHSTFGQLLQEQFGVVGDLFSVYLTPSLNQPGSVVIFGGYDLDLVRRRKPQPWKIPLLPTAAVARGSDSNSRVSSGTANGQPDVGEGRRRVWQRGRAQARLRGSAASQQQYQAHRAAVDIGGDLGGEPWTSGSGALAVGPTVHDVREIKNVDGLSMPYSAAASAGLSSEGVHGEGYGARVDGHEEVGAAVIEKQRAPEAGGKAGNGQAQIKERAIEDAGVDGNKEGDEPVIVWTPVIEYRGSLSYWTVQLAGWRTETTTEATDGSIDDGDGIAIAAAAVPTAATVQEHAYGSDEQNRHDRRAAARGVTTGREMCPVGCQAIVDTGSSLLVPPRSQYRAVMHQITGGRTDCKEHHGMISCSRCSLADFPDIVISVAVMSEPSSQTAPLSASISRSHSDSDSDVSIKRNKELQAADGDGSGGGGTRIYQEFRLKPSDYLSQSWDGCEILIGEGRATDIWTLGDAFIKTYMTIFDIANLRVGFVCADGGRCQGGASPPWLPFTRFCWPFMGSVTDPVESAEARGAYCLYLHYSFVGWALMFTSVLLCLAGCLLCAAEENGSSGKSSGNSVLTSQSSQPSEQHPLVSNPPFPFLITGQQDQQDQQQQLLELPGNVASEDDNTEAAHGGGDGGGKNPPRHGLVGIVGGKAVSVGTTPQRRRAGHRNGGVLSGWVRGSKDYLLSIRVSKVTSAQQRSPPPTPCPGSWTPSKTAHSGTDQHRPRQFWPSHGGSDGRDGSGIGGAVALGTFGDGMRSRGGTPRPCCPSSSVGGGHNQH